MKVTQVSIMQTDAARFAGRPTLTPELLAATGARYSRSNDGLEAILARIDPENTDKSVDTIFRMIDYGHQSIADMAPVAMFIDGLSIWLAYYVWTLCPTAGGQESSTRYIKLTKDGLVSATELGIANDDESMWNASMAQCFDAYQAALEVWEEVVSATPSIARIPSTLLTDSSDKGKRQVARMRRNFAFDRARYFLPVAAKTNMMLIMSARGWVQLCQVLLSHELPEAVRLGRGIREELYLSAPRLIKHAVFQQSVAAGLLDSFERLRQDEANMPTNCLGASNSDPEAEARPFLEAYPPVDIPLDQFAKDLSFHDNRYAWVGEGLRRTGVRFGWDAVAFAEIRDLNRHRTGNKYCPLIPVGFYYASDQVPSAGASKQRALQTLANKAGSYAHYARSRLQQGEQTYVYWTALGVQYRFEHLTTADKFIYEAELRTGVGAHYRYAQHLRDVLTLWYSGFPNTRGLVLEGSAEPE